MKLFKHLTQWETPSEWPFIVLQAYYPFRGARKKNITIGVCFNKRPTFVFNFHPKQ